VIAAAESNRDALTGRRREALLGGSDADLEKLDNDISAANRLLDRLRAIAEELDARLAQAREAESDAARARRRAELLAKIDSGAKFLQAEYPKAARAIADLIERDARLEIEIENFNKGAPADERLRGAEYIVRHRSAEPSREIGRSTVFRWCREGDNQPLGEEFQAAVVDSGGGRGLVPSSPGCVSPGRLCVKRKFERVEFLEAERVGYNPSLALSVNLPGVASGDAPFWFTSQAGTTAYQWVRDAEKLRVRVASPPASRRTKVEFHLIDDGSAPAPAEHIEPQPVELDISRQGGRKA
jgi:hypothetical protein